MSKKRKNESFIYRVFIDNELNVHQKYDKILKELLDNNILMK